VPPAALSDLDLLKGESDILQLAWVRRVASDCHGDVAPDRGDTGVVSVIV